MRLIPTRLFLSINRSIRYSNESQTIGIGVYTTYDTDRQDTCEADNHTDTAVCVGSERTYRLVFGFVDIHCFDYHKVMIEIGRASCRERV